MDNLEIKKFYIDSRFRSSDSNTDTDFIVDLPKTFNVPDNTVCYVDDVTIPVSWATVSQRNNTFYFATHFDGNIHYFAIVLDEQNYNSTSFTTELQTKLNEMMTYHFGNQDTIEFTCTYALIDNRLEISFEDKRLIRQTNMQVNFYSDRSVREGQWDTTVRKNPRSINDNIGLQQNFYMYTSTVAQDFPTKPFYCYLDLHGMRNLYLFSSSLANYDIISNFNQDTIIKKIPIRANYNEIIFDSASEGFDYINISKRSISRIDLKLCDSYGNPVDLRDNHWSLSLVFQRQN